ncbi:CBO0543 family protein [Tepidibacter aestuarii]|uniref:CBO0543 family protein n=1 Tax=Tepidibacter aestuarii TaxID=2925782 RepID=UPI0020BD5324|nr:CBO0543 family protein [Tepidibacter aestuarii]CAH2213211.1 conserved membrane protein of unknown function [Tepidibacter aestuarii]
MLKNWFLFFIPFWIFGLFLFKKDKKIVLIIAPFGSVLSHIINQFGVFLDLWKVTPIKHGPMSRLPADIGVYAVLSSFMIYLIHQKKFNPNILVLLFTSITTLFELILVLFGKVIYCKGWNILLTFFSYLIAYFLIYCFYLYLKKLDTFTSN